jgi:tRNA-splicing ligase RtcB
MAPQQHSLRSDDKSISSGKIPKDIIMQSKTHAPVRLIACDRLPPTQEEITRLTRIAKLDDVTQVVALPDLHLKPKLETPSSTATATGNTIVIGLSSPSPNCSMALARTSLYIDDLDNDKLDAVFGELARRMPLNRRSPVLSSGEMINVLLKGGAAVIERYNLDPATLKYMDQQGNAISSNNVDAGAITEAVPRLLQEIGCRHFALVGKGNHFLEFQVVDKVINEKVARAWNISQGQIVVMYHADSGYLGAFVGRLYAHRRKNTWRGRIHEWKLKLPFQLRTGQANRLLHRINYHLLPRRLPPIPANSEEGQRALLALQAASNYAYANRLAVLAALRDALQVVWGENYATTTLLWDAPHNSIRQEIIAGQKLWIHRHNATRVVPPSCMPTESPFVNTGHPVLLPGTDRTSSYLCTAGEGAINTLHSADHGTGHSVVRLGQLLTSNKTARLYTYKHGLTKIQPRLSDDGLEEVLTVLNTYDIAQPVAKLRPLAVLKEQK